MSKRVSNKKGGGGARSRKTWERHLAKRRLIAARARAEERRFTFGVNMDDALKEFRT